MILIKKMVTHKTCNNTLFTFYHFVLNFGNTLCLKCFFSFEFSKIIEPYLTPMHILMLQKLILFY